MALFDDLGKKITETSRGVVQKTKNTAETVKLNNMISNEEKCITNFFTELGKAYFELHADCYEPNFEQVILGIKESKKKIENYSEQVKKLNGVVQCPNCNGDVPYGAQFCNSCGYKMNTQSEHIPAKKETMQSCDNCGSVMPLEMLFCTNCGSKLTKNMSGTSVPNKSPVSNVITCSSCGRKLPQGAIFCTGCGQKL